MSDQMLDALNALKLETLRAAIDDPEHWRDEFAQYLRRERETYMFGYGMSFQDYRERKAFDEGRLLP